jgi:serine/threonine protein kinase
VVSILIQLCGALHEAHQRGFVHGNIKPRNVILCERGGLCDVAKLTDFGFALVEASPAEDLRALWALSCSLIGGGASELEPHFTKSSSAKQLAIALRALVDDGWSSKNAREWWADHRKTSVSFASPDDIVC